MKQLRAVRRQVEIQATLDEFLAVAFVDLVAQQISQLPIVRGYIRNTQRHVTLARVRRDVNDGQIEDRSLALPLNHDQVPVRRVAVPRFSWRKQSPFGTTNGSLSQHVKQTLVECSDTWLNFLRRAAHQMDINMSARAAQLSFMKKAHSGQGKNEQSCGAMFLD